MARCPRCDGRFPLRRLLALRLREEVACPECGHGVRLSYRAYLLDALVIAGVVYLMESFPSSSTSCWQTVEAVVVVLAVLSWFVPLRCRG